MGEDPSAHARIGRLEERVDAQAEKLGEVAEDTAWIKGYLEKHEPLPNGRAFQRDAGMVAGGGGVVGTLLFLLERFFGG